MFAKNSLSRWVAAIGLSCVITTSASAEVKVGDKAVPIEADKIVNSKIKKLKELKRSLVLYEYFAYWWGPCKAGVPHLNQLVEKYGKKGFVVVGVTDDDEAKTMKYIEDTKWNATVVFESGLSSMREYGFQGFPSSVLVNAKGEVVWSGHPAGLTDSEIEKNLQGARAPGGQSPYADALKPDIDAPKKYQAIAKKIAGGQVGGGMVDLEKALAGKIADADKAAVEEMQADVKVLYDEEMKRATDSFEAKRYFDAKFTWTRLEKAFKGHTLADEPKQKLAELAADTTIVEELAAGAEIHKALVLREADDIEGCLKALKRITGGSLRQTAEGGRAAALIEEIEAEKKAKRK